MNYKKKSEKLAQLIREQTLIMCHEAKAAHVASSLSIIDLISVLYENILKLTPSSFNKNNRNYFILSKGHASAAIYSLLAIKNFFPLKLLKTFGKKVLKELIGLKNLQKLKTLNILEKMLILNGMKMGV